MAGWLGSLADRGDDPDERATILDSVRLIESEPSLMGRSAHLLVVAEMPEVTTDANTAAQVHSLRVEER